MNNKKYSLQAMHAQTARIGWQELEKHFARGKVIRVDSDIDLVEVATCFANDNTSAVQNWLTSGQVRHLDTKTARDWAGRQPELWAVVVAPWVLVQERRI
jgi:hypothetical protein